MEWKKIKEFEDYMVSDTGIVVSLPRDYKYGTIVETKQLKQHITRGYMRVTLHKNGKKYKRCVHRLVAEAFIPNLEHLPFINHKDECKTNNMVSNLEWCTTKYNNNYGHRNQKISERVSKKVRQLTIEGKTIREWPSIKMASRALGINDSNISSVIHGKSKTSGGYKWERV